MAIFATLIPFVSLVEPWLFVTKPRVNKGMLPVLRRLKQIAGSGRWALKNIQRGYFLGSSQDELKCTAKAPGEAEYWLVHLAARPQVLEISVNSRVDIA